MGTFSSLTDEHCNATTYEDGEAFASGLDVHMAVAGRQWSRPLLALLPAAGRQCTAHRRQPAGLRILKRAGEGSDPTCSPRRSLRVPAGPRDPPVDTKKLPPWGVAFCGNRDACGTQQSSFPQKRTSRMGLSALRGTHMATRLEQPRRLSNPIRY